MTETQTSGEIVLGQNNYGKSEVRVFKVKRDTPGGEIWDLDIRVVLEGDFEAVYLKGDNTDALATDTMRNTCYALAKDHLTGSIEDFGLTLVDTSQGRSHRDELLGRDHAVPLGSHRGRRRAARAFFVRNRGERRAKCRRREWQAGGSRNRRRLHAQDHQLRLGGF